MQENWWGNYDFGISMGGVGGRCGSVSFKNIEPLQVKNWNCAYAVIRIIKTLLHS